ncbi:hypothetical protein SRB5_29850 [Streptomyces sp. RB5]|uniref:Uncharacterized protein n=1 Tax=Streptomyces smaragdinus TaxID=2585196 RepID=A0A7K0CHF9_9ACTN|nr:hypothetical protein [Streptomyces smaragdinus]MQY12846.1 hypothetical protein [Streptomyces smaragdinus]
MTRFQQLALGVAALAVAAVCTGTVYSAVGEAGQAGTRATVRATDPTDIEWPVGWQVEKPIIGHP